MVANERVANSQHISVVSRRGFWWMEWAPRGKFWTLVFATLLFNFGISIYFFLYNLFMLDLGFREKSLGMLTSALAFGSMAGTIPIGMVARRVGLKNVMISCLVIMAVGFGARVFLFWYPAQLAFAFFDGVMLCGWVVCLSPAVANAVEEPDRPFAFSVLSAVAVATGSLGGFVGGNMPEWCQRLGLRVAGIVISAFEAKRITLVAACVSTALAAWPIMRLNSDTPLRSATWIQRPSPFLLRFLLANACWAAVLGAFNPFTNVFFVRYLGTPTAHLGDFFSIAQLLQAGAVLLMPIVLQRTGLISGIMVAQLAAAAAVGLLATGRGLLQEEAIYCIFMAAQHMCDPGIQSILMGRVAPDERSGAGAMNFLAISLAQAAAASLTGTAFNRFGYPPVLVGIALATVGAAVGFRILCAPRLPSSQYQ